MKNEVQIKSILAIFDPIDNGLPNLKEYDFKYRLLQYWKNLGMSEVEKYNSSLGFSYYMSKHIGKTEINSWDFISNL